MGQENLQFLKAMTRLIPIKHGAVYLNGQSIYQMRTRDVAQKLAIICLKTLNAQMV